MNLSALNSQFGIDGRLEFRPGPGGFASAHVSVPAASATVTLQGANVIDWTPRGATPVLWLSEASNFSPGKSIRGGVPVCWPWFGPHDSESTYPAHGYARTVPWEVIAASRLPDDRIQMRMRLIESDATQVLWPQRAVLESEITVGKALEIALSTRNIGNDPFVVGEALHAYFRVSDARQITIAGLDGLTYIDKLDDGRRREQRGAVSIKAETDRIYLESSGDCLIDDPGFNRRVRIAKRGSRSTVVWNPWIEKSRRLGDFEADGHLGMVCVESANCADAVVTVPPGEEHRLWVRYSVESL